MSNKSFLGKFPYNDDFLYHYINTKTDNTSLETASREVYFEVFSDCITFWKTEKRIGKFKTDKNQLWYFECNNGDIIETGNTSLIKAEMKVFKDLLGVN